MTQDEQIIKWGSERGLVGPFAKGNPASQYEKLLEEVGELGKALIEDDGPSIIDAIGDIQVVLILLCELLDLKRDECLASAYEEISGRTGKMVDGQFVKDK